MVRIRPSVRGVAMNPIDHHGGGEGKTLVEDIPLHLGECLQRAIKLVRKQKVAIV